MTRVSLAGWIVSHWVIPRLYPKRAGVGQALRDDIAINRAAGPSLPGLKHLRGRRFVDTIVAGVRTMSLAPDSGPSGPMRIFYIHGGAYVFDLMDIQWTIAAGLVDRIRTEIVVPLYPLAPESDVEQGLAAVKAVYLELVKEVGAANISILGDSAGGGLALALVQHLKVQDQPQPACLVLYFPWLDASVSSNDQPALAQNDPILDIERLRACGRMWAGQRDVRDPLVSPLFGDHNDLPPTLVLTGSRDLLLSDTRRYVDQRPDMEVEEYPHMFHGWIAAPVAEARLALDRTRAFIARYALPSSLDEIAKTNQSSRRL